MTWRSVYFGTLVSLGLLVLATPYPLTHSTYLIGWGLAVALALYLLTGSLYLLKTRPDRPLTDLIENRGAAIRIAMDRLLLFVSATLFLTWLPPLKAMIPAYAGFWADAPLIRLERTILGTNAFDLAHSVVPRAALPVIDLIYAMWGPTIVIALAAIVTLSRNPGRFLVSWALCWVVLGVFAAGLLASAGPIFGPHLGLGFEHVHQQLDGTLAMRIKDNLWHVHSTNSLRLGGGISAAPSLHCAISFLFVFLAWPTRWRIPALLYAGLIWFGSVYLGWHYAVDGLLSLVGVAVIWNVSGALAGKAGVVNLAPIAASDVPDEQLRPHEGGVAGRLVERVPLAVAALSRRSNS